MRDYLRKHLFARIAFIWIIMELCIQGVSYAASSNSIYVMLLVIAFLYWFIVMWFRPFQDPEIEEENNIDKDV